MSKNEYLSLADELATDIAEGRLSPGERLPPQRNFAYERGIAASTATRVYAELLRRGLVVGEVGRGTFVSGQSGRGDAATHDPGNPRVDLEFNFPIISGQSMMIAENLASLMHPDVLQNTLRPVTTNGTPAARELFARFLSRNDWTVAPESLVFTGGGRQAIAAAIAASVPTGGRCGVEAISYPQVKGVAARLGITLVPLAMDEYGLIPEAMEKAHREASLSAVYVQPVLHNPLGITMPPDRRRHIVELAQKLDLPLIEDLVYGFLTDEVPLAQLAPDHCIVLDSLSKRVAPGLTLGFVKVPLRLRERIMASIRSGGWGASGFAFVAAQRLVASGTVEHLVARKREDARLRQQVAASCLAGHEIRANLQSYHLWLTLPERWRSQTFVAAAARQGIAITPSSAFAISPGHAPNAVRLALAAPPLDQLREALQTLSRMINTTEQDLEFVD